MIDTLKITILNIDLRKINRPEYFSPEFKVRSYSQTSETERKESVIVPYSNKFILRKDLLIDEYQPKAELYEKINNEKMTLEYVLKIEFSVPKIVYENNLVEIDEKEKDNFISNLQTKIRKCGISVEKTSLENAPVGKIHIGKNIILPNNVLMVNILRELKKTSLGKNYDMTETTHTPDSYTKTQQKNTSETLQHYCGSKDYAFYDKIKDILNKKGKSVDKEKTPYEKEMVSFYGLENKSVFRYEYRLNKPQTIKSEINSFYSRDYKTQVTLNDLFNEDLWKIILIKSWDRIVKKPENQLVLKFNKEESDIFKQVMIKARNNKADGHSLNSALTSFGLADLAQKYGIKVIKSEFKKIWSERACGERFDKKIEEANDLLVGLSFSDDINFIDKEIRRFERLTRYKIQNLIQ